MSDFDDLYRDVILDHFQHPRNHGTLENANVSTEGVNPLCGDQIFLTARVDGDRIQDVRIDGKGCSISQSSASIMSVALKGKTLEQARALVESFKGVMLEGKPVESLPEDLEEATAFEGVKKFPVRLKCALLAWNTFLEGLEQYGRNRQSN